MATAEPELREIVVSMETIKPSSPTPQHLFTHTLSRIDQLIPPIHIGVVLFYLKGDVDVDDDGSAAPADAASEKPRLRLRQLKRSLSDALTLYYPLAGRIGAGVSTVDCTDEGIDFIEARVTSCPLSAVLIQKPAPADHESETVDRLLPCSRRCTIAGGPLLVVKASTFPCGGLAVGICLNHKVADGQSLAFFLKTWAAIARGVDPDAEVRRPTLDVAVPTALFPPLGMLPPPPSMPPAAARPLVTRRFVLDGSKICALREQHSGELAGGSTPQQPHWSTRVEAVTALLWRCLIRAYCSSSFREDQGAPAREFAACHAVGLRARIQPPLPETAFGNIVTTAITPAGLVIPIRVPRWRTSWGGADHDDEVSSALRRRTEELTSTAIRGVDGAYIRETLQGAGGPFAFAGRLGEYLQRGTKVVWFSSMWGFPFYEADFGWGRPAWVAWAGFDAVQMGAGVGLMGRREGGGHMEARVVLEAEEMAKLRRDPEFLSLLASDPFPSLDTTSLGWN